MKCEDCKDVVDVIWVDGSRLLCAYCMSDFDKQEMLLALS